MVTIVYVNSGRRERERENEFMVYYNIPLHAMYDTGILQGVSHLLLVYDQYEVRKIIKSCEGVIDYIKVRGRRKISITHS